MTVSTTTTKNSYSANGTLHSFAYGFKIFADADLTVIVRSATGTETTKTLNTHYVVTNAGTDSGGNVLFKFNTGTSSDAHYSTTDHRPASGETVVILRTLTKSQGTDYVENDPFPSTSHEDALDRLTFITQELQEEVDRTIKLSKTNTMTSPEFTTSATDRASKILSFDSSGELSVTQELGTFKGDWAASTAYVIRDIVKDTSTNNIFIVTTAHTSSGSEPLTTNANSAKYSLIVDAASATTSATNAASSASAAASSASTASTQASNASSSASTASTQASNASTSASTASTQATNAANSATAAASSLSTFQGQYHGAASSDPSSNLDAGDLYFNTSDGELKVYTGSAWVSTKPTSSEQTNINTLAASAVVTDMSLLATSDVIADMALLADSDVIADMNTLAVTDIINDINTLATSDIVTDLNTLATSDFVSDLNLLASSSNVTAINNVSGSITNVNTVATNLSGVNSFAERYRVQSGVPSSDNDVGDLVFDTAANTLKVFGSSGFQNAGSSVNGTSARFHYDITGAVTSVTGSDANGNTLAYDAGFIDVYVNGVRMSTADVTVTSGDTVTFASALADGDEVDIVCFGTFVLANIVSTGALNSGSITSGFGSIDIGSSTITTTGAITGGTLTGTLQTAAQTNITSVGTLTALTVDDITINGSTISDSGDFTLDVGGDIILDADGADIKLKDGGTQFGQLYKNGNDFRVESNVSDGDLVFTGNDGGTGVTALTLDMSDGGAATFNGDLFTNGNLLRTSTNNGNTLGGGTASNNGGNITVYGGSHASLASNIRFRSGSTVTMLIDSTGAVTKPLQPAFMATSSSQSNLATSNTLAFGNEVFDQNADYNNSNYIFTAPVTGRYQLNATIRTDNLDSAASYTRIFLKTSNRNYEAIYYLGGLSGDPSYWTFTITTLADMDASDTAFLEWSQSGGASQAGLGNVESSFSGYLVA